LGRELPGIIVKDRSATRRNDGNHLAATPRNPTHDDRQILVAANAKFFCVIL
jgi:hypothetical protein